MWLSAIKLAVSAGSKIYANKQRTKIAMSDAQLMHASRMAEGKEAYQGKLLEARQSDWKDEAVLIILSLPIGILAWAVVSEDPTAMDKVKLDLEQKKTFYQIIQRCKKYNDNLVCKKNISLFNCFNFMVMDLALW